MQWLKTASPQITQGSIVDGIDWGYGEYNPLSIVLSNACDIDHGKCSFLMVIALLPAAETLSESKEFKNKTENANAKHELTKKSWKSLYDFLSSYIHNKNICRYYFFDPQPILDAPLLVADFQMIKSVSIDQISHLENIAQLSSPYIEQMILHFASYTARIPSDRVEQEIEEKLINELALPYHKSASL